MLQERPYGDAGGGHLRREQELRQPLLQPASQGNPQREHPRVKMRKSASFQRKLDKQPRVATQEPRQRHRELPVFRKAAAHEVQQLHFRHICATLERVCTCNEVSNGGGTTTYMRTYCLFSKIVQKYVP